MNKTITGKEAVELIEAADAVIIMDDGQAVVYPSVEQPDEDEFWNVDLAYDYDGQTWEFTFHIWGNDSVEVENNQLMLLETNGEITPIKLLKIQEL